MAKYLVIVESPAKAKTIKKFLGKSYKVEASMGHVRDLPKSQMGVDIDDNFEPKYITIRGKGELLSKLRKEAKTSDKIYLATDPDREGEAISWHLFHALKLDDKKTSRITFNEITKNAVKSSIKEARKIDMNLVDAQQARRVLDRIVGYSISPLLWKKIRKGLSAGRVQSVALRLICDREDEIDNFIPTEYWSIEAEFITPLNKKFEAKFYGLKDKKLEVNSKEEADVIIQEVKKQQFKVEEVKRGERIKKPVAPFTTSTLQQEASKYLGFSTQKTMRIAQQLYEGIDLIGEGTVGLITYVRTDSVRISQEAQQQAKEYIEHTFGKEYLNLNPSEYKGKGKTQDAHEAIRPTDINRHPKEIIDSLSKDQYKLYELIWQRFTASQMAPAKYDTFSVKVSAGKYIFTTSGSSLKFDGFLAVYNKEQEKEEITDFEIKNNDLLQLNTLEGKQHFTQPPARYSEASLVKTLEENGVGRPSTYAPTITTLLARGYVVKENRVLYPTELGEIVNDILKNYFKSIVDVEFTAQMEEQLDEVESGEIHWRKIIQSFYPDFKQSLQIAEQEIGNIDLEEITDVICENCGKNMVVKYGRYGKFLACPGFPECKNTKPLYEEAGVNCPECNGKVIIKKTKKGRKYYGCENNPECQFMSWNKPSGEKCPKCNSYLIEKGKKTQNIVCSNSECGYIHISEHNE
ncbi:MAG: topoisomerase [Epulopiscium sp.]|jgi:DNA topoisomerase-1|uniref:type I DNA topoisomerase n=1 Tax=Defluviitalea raffinosedens TaxID=1450156 RepID=UPI001762F5CC|nr:type I DNA topoisomerase [Defluviitalea raffinosedens]MBM7685216.1 DNA topoisomerase-1 [Defluviitalea raffinosedens]MBZ4669421.1 topA [Defluviitaleaceae bacterium]MDK2789464.1 topoisomerase [Candidatus Epulonipiscium sp.]HHW67345.1 type I DNA topoisomerase [Candidatus Epulonipiscium sp.]